MDSNGFKLESTSLLDSNHAIAMYNDLKLKHFTSMFNIRSCVIDKMILHALWNKRDEKKHRDINQLTLVTSEESAFWDNGHFLYQNPQPSDKINLNSSAPLFNADNWFLLIWTFNTSYLTYCLPIIASIIEQKILN